MNAPVATVYEAFRRVAARRGDAEFLCVEPVTAAAFGIDPGPRSWREVAGEVERLRAAYAQAGYGHGHRVGLLLENRPAFFTHWLALNALGISIVPIHADLRATEWTYLIGHSEISLAVTLPSREGALRAAAMEAGTTLDTIRPEVAGRIPAARSPAAPGARTDRPQHRVRAALHLGDDRPAEGLPPGQRLLPARRRVVPRPARARRGRCRRRPLHHAAAAQPHERARVLVDGGDPLRRLHRPARPLPPAAPGGRAFATAARRSFTTSA